MRKLFVMLWSACTGSPNIKFLTLLTSTLSAIYALTWATQLALTVLSRASIKCWMPQVTQWRIQSVRKSVHPPTMCNDGWIHRLIHCQAAWDSCTVFEHGDCYITVQGSETSQYVAECVCYYQNIVDCFTKYLDTASLRYHLPQKYSVFLNHERTYFVMYCFF